MSWGFRGVQTWVTVHLLIDATKKHQGPWSKQQARTLCLPLHSSPRTGLDDTGRDLPGVMAGEETHPCPRGPAGWASFSPLTA